MTFIWMTVIPSYLSLLNNLRVICVSFLPRSASQTEDEEYQPFPAKWQRVVGIQMQIRHLLTQKESVFLSYVIVGMLNLLPLTVL